ncbi:MAG: SOS response-associated peptidase family protein [Sphingobium limneticum]
MSRLHTVRATIAEVAAHFAIDNVPAIAVPNETVEGLPGLVVFEKAGRRILRPMTWGFPRLTREMRERGEEAGRIGLVADLTNPMWEQMVVDPRYRCLIVLTHFANPDGVPGAKTRTWFSVKNQPIVAWAGFCRNLMGDGPVYAGMTMETNSAIPPTNDRMPVLLDPHEYDQWLRGSIQNVIRFQFRTPFASERMRVQQTEDSWRSKEPPPGTDAQQLLI